MLESTGEAMTEPSDPAGLPAQQPPTPPPQPGPGPYAAQFGYTPVPVNNNLGWAIGGILVCWPFGIPSLIKSLAVNSLWAQGQFDQAQLAAAEAKKWGKIGIIVGASAYGLLILAYVVFFIVYAVLIGSLVATTQ